MSHLPGMGALIGDGGCGFRVWAPHADQVSMAGSFNGWNNQSHPLEHEDGGYWYGWVEGAKAGDEYQFFLRNGEHELWRIDPYAMQVTNSIGNALIVDHGAFDWEGDTFSTPNHNNLVIYEMHVGSFASHGGDLDQVAERLDHISHLGVNCIQLMPLMEFAGDRSWGYNPAHIFAVESSYGGPNALKGLIREAHRCGISVIVDVVYNHLGPSDLDLWQFDGWSANGKGGIYFYNDWRSATPWGDTRPDYGRAEVRQFLRDNANMWLDHYHVQGLRYDMTPYMRSVSGFEDNIPEGWDMCREINSEIRARRPDAILIAEDMHGLHAVTDTGPKDAHFHSQWDTHFVHPVREAITTMSDEDRSVAKVVKAISYDYGDAYERVIFTESHDEVSNGKARVPTEIDAGNPQGWFAQKRSTLGAALVLTAPGIPMLFQGQEFLQGEWFRDDVPLDWHLSSKYHGIVRLYRDLVRLRLNNEGESKGLMGQDLTVIHANDQSKVIAFHRWMNGGPGDDVVVVANLRNATWGQYRIGFPHGGSWRLLLNSDSRIYSDDFGDQFADDVVADGPAQDQMAHSAEVAVAPYSVLVYTRA